MQDFLAQSRKSSHLRSKGTQNAAYRQTREDKNANSFAYPETLDVEEEKEDQSGPKAVYKVISEQAETHFEDMVASNLVQFEYDLFRQIKSQLS